MNHKQKLGYMAIGVGIMALGIIIGQFVTPDIEAQPNGVFDEIVCKKLSVIDEEGNEAIELSTSSEGGRHIFFYDKKGIQRISLVVEEVFGSTVAICEKDGGLGIVLSAVKPWQ